MERETKKLTTPSGKEIVIKTYLTARERNAIADSILRKIKINPEKLQMQKLSGQMPEMETDASVIRDQEKATLEQMIISYAGATENIYELLCDERPCEYDFVVAEINKITAENLTSAK